MQKKPSKPVPTRSSTATLLAHYNSLVEPYNAAVLAMDEKKRPETGLQVQGVMEGESIVFKNHPNPCCEVLDRHGLILLIRRQNHRLKRHIKRRALELLYEKVRDTDQAEADGGSLELAGKKDWPLLLKDGKYTVGHTYQHILDVLFEEFPESSTSVACLRWYVVHEREEAIDQGLPWPDLPHFRPRSSARKEA